MEKCNMRRFISAALLSGVMTVIGFVRFGSDVAVNPRTNWSCRLQHY